MFDDKDECYLVGPVDLSVIYLQVITNVLLFFFFNIITFVTRIYPVICTVLQLILTQLLCKNLHNVFDLPEYYES